MIRIIKPEQGPAILVETARSGPAQTRELCEQYDNGVREFEFKSSVYAHDSVKVALRAAQYDKCCFCESKISHVSYGDVEHFRPKKGWCQRPNDPIEKPGYYWLAYDWQNLLLCCTLCNGRHKRNYFPLSNPTRRARSHHDDVTFERPFLVNPVTDDPNQFITFRQHVAIPVRRSRRGKATIEALGLNRRELIDYRLRKLRIIRTLLEALNVLEERHKNGLATVEEVHQIGEIRHCLRQESQPDAEYASMNRTFLAGTL